MKLTKYILKHTLKYKLKRVNIYTEMCLYTFDSEQVRTSYYSERWSNMYSYHNITYFRYSYYTNYIRIYMDVFSTQRKVYSHTKKKRKVYSNCPWKRKENKTKGKARLSCDSSARLPPLVHLVRLPPLSRTHALTRIPPAAARRPAASRAEHGRKGGGSVKPYTLIFPSSLLLLIPTLTLGV